METIRQQDAGGIDLVVLGKVYDKLYPTIEEQQKCNWNEHYDQSGNLLTMGFVSSLDFESTIEFVDSEFNRLKVLIDTWPRFNFARDRQWVANVRTKLGLS